MTHLSPIENLFAVEVPDLISDPHCYRVNNESIMLKWNDVKHPFNPHDIIRVDRYYGDLKDYKWPEILFTTKDCSEEQAAGIVECISMGGFGRSGEEWKDYNGNNLFRTAIESLQSLFRANGLEESKNYLLIKKSS